MEADGSVKPSPPGLKTCPACHQPIPMATNDSAAAGGDADLGDPDDADANLFLNRHSNRQLFSPFDDATSGSDAEGALPAVELSPVALRFFEPQQERNLYVPTHLYSCLASHEAGFRMLRDHGHLVVSS